MRPASPSSFSRDAQPSRSSRAAYPRRLSGSAADGCPAEARGFTDDGAVPGAPRSGQQPRGECLCHRLREREVLRSHPAVGNSRSSSGCQSVDSRDPAQKRSRTGAGERHRDDHTARMDYSREGRCVPLSSAVEARTAANGEVNCRWRSRARNRRSCRSRFYGRRAVRLGSFPAAPRGRLASRRTGAASLTAHTRRAATAATSRSPMWRPARRNGSPRTERTTTIPSGVRTGDGMRPTGTQRVARIFFCRHWMVASRGSSRDAPNSNGQATGHRTEVRCCSLT